MVKANKSAQKPEAKVGGVSDTLILETAKNIDSEKAKMDKHRGEIGQYFKQFEEAGGHKKALKTALQIENMETDAAQDFLRALDYYMTILGTKERVLGQEDMFSGPAAMPPAPAAAKIESKAAVN